MITNVYNASDARQNLYTIIKTVANGLEPIEINLRNTNPVIMMSKADYDGWIETLDIMMSPQELKTIRTGRKNKKIYTSDQMKKILSI
jgi:prevent-host-death family protein